MEKLLTGNNEENAVIYYGMANVYSELKDHENAIKYYTKAIELNPKFVQAYIGKAKDCGDLRNWQCSLDNYEALKKMYPDEPFFYYMSALYKTNTKDLTSLKFTKHSLPPISLDQNAEIKGPNYI